MAGNGVPERRTVCGAAWPNQQRGLKEQVGPFLQGVLLGGRSRCWTVVKLVISPINLNKISSVSKSNIETEVVKMQDTTGIQERGCAVWQLANFCDGTSTAN